MRPPGSPYNGPILPIDPPTRPEVRQPPVLSSRPTWQELASCYAEIAADHAAHHGAMYRELDEMRAAIIILDTRFESRIAAAVEEISRRLRGEPPRVTPASGVATAVHQRSTPSLSEYNPDYTPGHGIRLAPNDWRGIQEMVDQLQRERDRITREKEAAAEAAHESDLKRQGAEEYANAIAKVSEMRITRIKKWVAIVAAIAAVLEGLSRAIPWPWGHH